MEKKCTKCFELFESTRKDAQFCSDKCRKASSREDKKSTTMDELRDICAGKTKKEGTFDELETLSTNNQIEWVLDYFGDELVEAASKKYQSSHYVD